MQGVYAIKAAWDVSRLLGLCFKKSNEYSQSSPGKRGKVAGISARGPPDIITRTLQSRNRPLNRSLSRPLNRPMYQPLNHLLNRLLNRPLNHPLNRLLNRPLNRPLNHPLNRRPPLER